MWLGIPRASWYRSRQPKLAGGVRVPQAERAYPNRISPSEAAVVVDRLNTDELADLSIRQAYYQLLDQGEYLCSLSSMHRIMRRAGQSVDRRRQATRRPVGPRHAPCLKTSAPGQVWCWDITTLPGPGRVSYKLYSVIDLYSRVVVAHRVEYHERYELACAMFTSAFVRQGRVPQMVHADNGSAMRSGSLRDLFASLNVKASYSRPRVSNDNPYAESLFKTLKYDLRFPDRFDTIEHARAWASEFFDRYNHHHHHAGLAGHTPARVHDGTWPAMQTRWQATKTAYAARHPERHRQAPTTTRPPDTVWINKPNHELSQTG